MNTISLENFKREVDQIREYLRHIQHVDNIAISTNKQSDTEFKLLLDVFKTEADGFRIVSNTEFKLMLDAFKTHYNSFRTDKKIFEYKATIISIYGLLEKYIEIWINEYLESLSKLIKDYNQLPEKIKEGHFNLSLKLLTVITSRESAKYQHIKKEQVLSKLNGCIQTPLNYELNSEAFTLLSGNLKHKKIVELLLPILENLNAGLSKNKTLSSYIQGELNTENLSALNPERLYSKIDDLVDRRNIIAHGSEVVDDLLATQILLSYIDFLEQYCQAIFDVFFEKYVSYESIHGFKQINVIHDVFNHSILAFEIESSNIKCGDYLIIKTAKNDFFKKTILDLQIDGISYPELRIQNKMNIAIRVEPKINRNCTFYIVR